MLNQSPIDVLGKQMAGPKATKYTAPQDSTPSYVTSADLSSVFLQDVYNSIAISIWLQLQESQREQADEWIERFEPNVVEDSIELEEDVTWLKKHLQTCKNDLDTL